MSTRIFVIDGDDAMLERCARLLQAEGVGVNAVSTKPNARLDGYARVVDVILALVNAEHDVRNLELLADHLRPRVSVPTIRGWLYAAGLRAGSVLALGRLIRAFCVSQARGVRLAGALSASDRRTVERFLRRAGLKDGQSVVTPCTLQELLTRQRLVRDSALLAEILLAMERSTECVNRSASDLSRTTSSKPLVDSAVVSVQLGAGPASASRCGG